MKHLCAEIIVLGMVWKATLMHELSSTSWCWWRLQFKVFHPYTYLSMIRQVIWGSSHVHWSIHARNKTKSCKVLLWNSKSLVKQHRDSFSTFNYRNGVVYLTHFAVVFVVQRTKHTRWKELDNNWSEVPTKSQSIVSIVVELQLPHLNHVLHSQTPCILWCWLFGRGVFCPELVM